MDAKITELIQWLREEAILPYHSRRITQAADALEAQAREIVHNRRINLEQAQTISEQAQRIAELEARIDELMLEYCPDEMTEEQKQNWAKHQAPAMEGGR